MHQDVDPPAPSAPAATGWAAQSLETSLRAILLAAVIVGELAMLGVILVGSGPGSWPVMVGPAVVAVYAAAARRAPMPMLPIPLGMALTGLALHLRADDLDSAQVFAGAWQVNFASVFVGIMWASPWLVPVVVVSALAFATAVWWGQPAWGPDFPVAIVVTQTAIIIALGFGIGALRRAARTADRLEAQAESDLHRAEVARTVSARIAEEARTIHDTAINTLGAIAMRVATPENVDVVRAQCARDVTQLDHLRADEQVDAAPGLVSVLAGSRLPIRRTGVDDDELRLFELRLGVRRAAAVAGCVREALNNAAKHSGADRVDVHFAITAGALRITVHDDGRGFDGRPRPGRGLEQSVLARAAEIGARATITSAPGAGTTIGLEVFLANTPTRSTALAAGVDEVVERIHRTAGLLWAAGATAVSLVLSLLDDTANLVVLLPMVALMTLALVLGVVTPLHRPRRWLGPALIAATLVVFALSAAATGFGTVSPWRWQALAATAPFVVMMSYRPGRRPVTIGIGLWVGWVLALAALAARDGRNAVGIVLIAGCVGIGFVVVWARFQDLIIALGSRTALSQRRALEARVAIDAESAAQATYRRWLDAGLDEASALLRTVASGVLDPTTEEVQQACGEEEAYLRQLVMVSPELVHLGHGLMPTFRRARDRGVDFRLRLGSQDAPDEATARGICDAVVQAIEGTAPGGTLTASVFPVAEGLQVTLTAPRLPARESTGGQTVVGHERMGDIELMLLHFAGVPESATSH